MKHERSGVLQRTPRVSQRVCTEKETVLRKLVLFLLLIVPMAAFAAPVEDFYQRMHRRGMAHFAAAEYTPAFAELRSAAFGFIDVVDTFETIHAYAAVAARRAGREAEARDSLMRIAAAEKIETHFPSVTLPEEIRTEVHKAAARLLTRDEATLIGVTPQMLAAALAERTLAVVPTPTKRPNVAVTAPREQSNADAAPPPAEPTAASKLADAQRALESGDITSAKAIYESLLTGPLLVHHDEVQLAEGLYRVHEYAKAARAFVLAGTLGKGEEKYHYCYAVSLYETGHFKEAKRELAAAMPHITMNDDVEQYRAKIEGASH
jgi:tetratricopeptide (TPR) repeat protein